MPIVPERGEYDLATPPGGIPGIGLPKLVSTILISSAVSGSAVGANGAIGTRVVFPYKGTITAMAVFVTTQNGNLDLGIYDATATTRTRLKSTGTTAVGTANNWQSVNLSSPLFVNSGDNADLMVAVSGTAAFAGATVVNAALTTLPAGFIPSPGGAAPKLIPYVNAAMFPLPASYLESAFNSTSFIPLILARYE